MTDNHASQLWVTANELCDYLDESGESAFSPLTSHVQRVRAALASLPSQQEDPPPGFVVEEDEFADWCTHLQAIQNASGRDAEALWSEEFLAWYRPAEWMGVHRAACTFIGAKMARQQERPARTDVYVCFDKDVACGEVAAEWRCADCPRAALASAWRAGYWHAGYTHDSAYADKQADEYAAQAMAAHPPAEPAADKPLGAPASPSGSALQPPAAASAAIPGATLEDAYAGCKGVCRDYPFTCAAKGRTCRLARGIGVRSTETEGEPAAGQPLTDAELEAATGEPHIDGYPLYSGLPPPARIAELKALLTREHGAGWEDSDAACLRVANRRCAELEAEVAALRADALRYRFLRDVYFSGKSAHALVGPTNSPEEIDARIDAATQGEHT